MNLDGELGIQVSLGKHGDGVRVIRAAVRSTRPHRMSRVFSGRTVQDVVSMVPRLFSICGRAQGIASALACEAASGVEVEPASTRARRLLVGVELVEAGLWQTLIDWPRAIGDEPETQCLASSQAALEATLTGVAGTSGFMPAGPACETVAASGRWARSVAGDVVSRQVLGVPLSRWDELRTLEDLGAWSASGVTPAAKLIGGLQNSDGKLGACEVALIPRADGQTERSLAQILESDPAGAPQWMGSPAETGPLARMQARPLVAAVVARFGRSALARFVARLGELCAVASGALPELGSRGLGTGRGVAWVETARGLLLHYAGVKEGRIQHYRIVAPTEWNFHPQGALVRGLEGATFASEAAARHAVGLLVQSLDPCVAWKLELSHA